MAQAQLIQGNTAELLAYLTRHPHQQEMMLIVPDKVVEEATSPSSFQTETMPEGTIFRNGVPLLPVQDARQSVTMEFVQRLMDEE